MRAALVFGVAGLDAYVHQRVVQKLDRQVIGNPSHRLIAEARALTKDDPGVLFGAVVAPDPIGFVRDSIEGTLTKRTFQHPGAIQEAFELIGIPNIWSSVADFLAKPETEIKKEVAEYVLRRHRIVHEADMFGHGATRPITKSYVENALASLERIVVGIEHVTGGIVE
jgi:hypothetical protein